MPAYKIPQDYTPICVERNDVKQALKAAGVAFNRIIAKRGQVGIYTIELKHWHTIEGQEGQAGLWTILNDAMRPLNLSPYFFDVRWKRADQQTRRVTLTFVQREFFGGLQSLFKAIATWGSLVHTYYANNVINGDDELRRRLIRYDIKRLQSFGAYRESAYAWCIGGHRVKVALEADGYIYILHPKSRSNDWPYPVLPISRLTNAMIPGNRWYASGVVEQKLEILGISNPLYPRNNPNIPKYPVICRYNGEVRVYLLDADDLVVWDSNTGTPCFVSWETQWDGDYLTFLARVTDDTVDKARMREGRVESHVLVNWQSAYIGQPSPPKAEIMVEYPGMILTLASVPNYTAMVDVMDKVAFAMVEATERYLADTNWKANQFIQA